MLKLGQFDLEFAFASARALGENVQDERSAVEDLALEDLLQVAALGGRKFVVENDRIDVLLAAGGGEFVGFAAADESGCDGYVQFLDAAANDVAAGGGGQFAELSQGILEVPRGAVLEFDPDEEDPFGSPSGCFDECFQLLSIAGRNLAHADGGRKAENEAAQVRGFIPSKVCGASNRIARATASASAREYWPCSTLSASTRASWRRTMRALAYVHSTQ